MKQNWVAEEESEEDGYPRSGDEKIIKVIVGKYISLHVTIELLILMSWYRMRPPHTTHMHTYSEVSTEDHH